MRALVLALTLHFTPFAIAAAPEPEVFYFVFAGNDLTDLRKEFEGPKPDDASLIAALKAGEGITSLVVRVTKVDGKVTEVHIFTTRVKQPKIEPARTKPFAPTDPDAKRLLKAVKMAD